MAFVDDRIAFIYYKGDLWVQDPADNRTCWDWCSSYFHMERDVWEKATRGYFNMERIQFYTGALRIPDMTVTPDQIEEVREICDELCSAGDAPVYNGVIPGEEGDVWPPLMVWNGTNMDWGPVA